MKTDRIITTVLSLFLYSGLFAQQRIDPTLEVRREFDAHLQEITKGRLRTSFNDSLARFNLSFNYSIFDKPIKNLYEFTPISYASIQKEESEPTPILMVKAGANYPLNPYGELHFRPNSGNKFAITLDAEHNSYLSNLSNVKLLNQEQLSKGELQHGAPSSKTSLALNPTFRWKSGEAGINANFNNINNSYYGFTDIHTQEQSSSFMKDSLFKRSNIMGASLFARSRNREHNSFYYNTRLSYSNLGSESIHPLDYNYTLNRRFTGDHAQIKSKREEKYLSLLVDFGIGFANFNTFSTGATYQSSNPQHTDSLSRSSLILHPRYLFKKGRWDFELGIKYNIWWEGAKESKNLYISAHASAEIIRDKFWLYAMLDGNNTFINYHKLLEINPWVSPNVPMQNIEQPIIAKAGFKGKIAERLAFNLYGGYEEYNNQLYFFANIGSIYNEENPYNSSGALYNKEKRTIIGANLFIHGSQFQGEIKGEYRLFKDGEGKENQHFGYSPLVINSIGRYNWRERIALSLEINYRQKFPTLFQTDPLSILLPASDPSSLFAIREVPSSFEANLELTYVHNKNFSIYTRINNIFNSTIIEYSSYLMPGINGGLGLIVKL